MAWLSEAWRFIKNEKNQKTLAFIGAGIAAVVVAGWQGYTHFAPSGSLEKPRPIVTVNGGGVAPGGDLRITQTGPGTLIVGGVHGIRPGLSKGLGATRGHPGRASEFLQDPGEAEGRARGPRQHPARVRQALSAARGGPQALHLR